MDPTRRERERELNVAAGLWSVGNGVCWGEMLNMECNLYGEANRESNKSRKWTVSWRCSHQFVIHRVVLCFLPPKYFPCISAELNIALVYKEGPMKLIT